MMAKDRFITQAPLLPLARVIRQRYDEAGGGTLTPAERLVFVLHDLFAVPFDEIGSIVGRSPAAAKQLASRARRRVRGSTTPSDAGKARQREVVEAFLRAARDGDLEGLLAVLDPDAIIRIDGAARIAGGTADAADTTRELRGAATWAK
jgi:RNA polymerase sigma-70 factor (ECF subfamily)